MKQLKGRGALLLGTAAAIVAAVIAQTADAAHPHASPSWTPPGLLASAKANPQQTFRVIVRGGNGVSTDALASTIGSNRQGPLKRFAAINGVATTLTGAELTLLSTLSSVLSIVPDAPVASAGLEESTLWPSAIDLGKKHGAGSTSTASNLPAIAIVDSGVDTTKTQDFGSRIVASVNLNSDNPSATGDDEGHGTMVAGIAAGASSSYAGVAPTAPIVSIRTADANGASHMSDVIAACDWILQHQGTYNIRVANFSLVSEARSSFVTDPLDAAVEQLWFHGIVVVTAAGNYGQSGGVQITHAPGNDPFVITVGALDTSGTWSPSDDVAAPWSAYGHSGDGFFKPEISAPGRWIVSAVPTGSTLATTAPARVVAPGYMWMSGTSLSTPMVAGAAAVLLGQHPGWTPGLVKGALMAGASALPNIADWAGGVGELDVGSSLQISNAHDADASLEQFVVSDGSGGTVFDGNGWEQEVQTNTDWSATDWSATDWSATDWSATDWSATDWSATDWSATDWSATAWLP
ncbi:MAG: S8 family serine peptidase [Gaiellaceae bacterium]